MGQIHALTENVPPQIVPRAKPGPVRQLNALANSQGKLVLEWQSPGGGAATHYRIERTHDGRAYEMVAEISGKWFCYDAPWREPWFYRVTAVNSRGPGGCRLVWFYQRSRHHAELIRFPCGRACA